MPPAQMSDKSIAEPQKSRKTDWLWITTSNVSERPVITVQFRIPSNRLAGGEVSGERWRRQPREMEVERRVLWQSTGDFD